jgi:hypothetical protein
MNIESNNLEREEFIVTIQNLLETKLGKIIKEIVDECELENAIFDDENDYDMDNVKNMNEFFEILTKNPNLFMDFVKYIGKKINIRIETSGININEFNEEIDEILKIMDIQNNEMIISMVKIVFGKDNIVGPVKKQLPLIDDWEERIKDGSFYYYRIEQ